MTRNSPAEKSQMSATSSPDVQFLLANERTLLAWIRTALALLAGGLALTQFGEQTVSKTLIGIAVILLGATMATTGYVRFRNASKAIHRGEAPIVGNGPKFQVIVVVIFAMAAVGIELVTLL